MIIFKLINYLIKLLIFIKNIYVFKKNMQVGVGRGRENQFLDGGGAGETNY